MAQATNIDFILRKVVTEKLRFWKVLDSDGKNELDIQDDIEVSPDESAVRLRTTLENLTGLVTVVLSGQSKAEKGAGRGLGPARDSRFTINLGGASSIQGTGVINNSSITAIRESMQREFDERFERMKEQFEHRKEMEEMKRMIADIQSQDPLEKYAPHLMQIFGMTVPQTQAPIASAPATGPLPPKPVALAGTEQDDAVDAKAELVKTLNRLIARDPNVLRNLSKLADLAEKKPEIYTAAVSHLHQI